jgi:hypothetical protein
MPWLRFGAAPADVLPSGNRLEHCVLGHFWLRFVDLPCQTVVRYRSWSGVGMIGFGSVVWSSLARTMPSSSVGSKVQLAPLRAANCPIRLVQNIMHYHDDITTIQWSSDSIPGHWIRATSIKIFSQTYKKFISLDVEGHRNVVAAYFPPAYSAFGMRQGRNVCMEIRNSRHGRDRW